MRPDGLSRREILSLLAEIGDRLQERGIQGEILLVGGSAMVVAFDARPSTKDVDAVFRPPGIIREIAGRIGEAHDLPPDWLNDAFKGFAHRAPDEANYLGVVDRPGLRVMAAPADYILAMKCLAARVGLEEKDKEDAVFLMRRLGLSDAVSVLGVVEKYCPRDKIPAKSAFFVEECVEAVAKDPRGPGAIEAGRP